MIVRTYTRWRKSRRSDGDGNCVEVAESDDGSMIGVRDSKDLNGAILEFAPDSWRNFLGAVRAGKFDPS